MRCGFSSSTSAGSYFAEMICPIRRRKISALGFVLNSNPTLFPVRLAGRSAKGICGITLRADGLIILIFATFLLPILDSQFTSCEA